MAFSRGVSLRRSSLPSHTILGVLAGGVLAGFILGSILMGTVDTMWQTGTDHHVRHEGINLETVDSLAGQASGAATSAVKVDSSESTASTASAVMATKPAGDTIHTVMTSGGSGYQNFQGRIMYGTYKLVQKMPGGEKLTGFTRILHRVKEDECMEEIPTFHAKPQHPECDNWCDFPVADRPNAVWQWIQAVKADPSLMKGAWVLLAECDYVWMKPLAPPGDAFASTIPGQQYKFGYIDAQHPNCAHIIKRLYRGGNPQDVPNSGPAPAILRFDDLVKVTPEWENVTAAIEADEEAKKVLGWVREMYAWDIALALTGVSMVTEEAPKSPLMVQPPADHSLGPASLCHYTWGAIYNDSTHEVFRWEKRDFTDPKYALKVPKLALPPTEFKPNTWHLQGHEPVTEDMHLLLIAMLTQMNKAIETLPELKPVI